MFPKNMSIKGERLSTSKVEKRILAAESCLDRGRQWRAKQGDLSWELSNQRSSRLHRLQVKKGRGGSDGRIVSLYARVHRRFRHGRSDRSEAAARRDGDIRRN